LFIVRDIAQRNRLPCKTQKKPLKTMDLYFQAAEIIAACIKKKGVNVRSLCLADKIKAKSATLKLVCSTLDHRDSLNTVLTACKLQKHLSRMRYPLMLVLVHELLVSADGLRRRGPQCGAVLKHAEALKKAWTDAGNELNAAASSAEPSGEHDAQKVVIDLPRYVRVQDKSPAAIDAVVNHFKNVDKISSVEKDDLVPGLLVLPPRTKLFDHAFLKAGKITLQDKASCLPVVVLDPPAGSYVADACAAPGNKTTQIASYMRNRGTVVAFDRDPKRVELLRSNVARCKAESCISVRHTDFLSVDPKDDPVLQKVTMVLCDPSCSGSGMIKRIRAGEDDEDNSEERLEQLAQFQTSVVLHAMSFPKCRKVVYSTCSIHARENEMVVREVLEKSEGKWELEHCLPAWHRRGDTSIFAEADKCARCDPQEDRMNGFFISSFVKKA
jgi:putative methyltransferase